MRTKKTYQSLNISSAYRVRDSTVSDSDSNGDHPRGQKPFHSRSKSLLLRRRAYVRLSAELIVQVSKNSPGAPKNRAIHHCYYSK